MTRLLRTSAVLAIFSPAGSALAHLAGDRDMHLHAGDAAGVLLVVALVGIAAWLDGRSK